MRTMRFFLVIYSQSDLIIASFDSSLAEPDPMP